MPAWLRASALLSGLALCSCQQGQTLPLFVVLVPPPAMAGEIDAELAIEGLSALLLARLRALNEVQVQVNSRGCEYSPQATHELRVMRELTAASALTTLQLRDCDGGTPSLEQLVQPRSARRDWSAEAAWWVGTQLQAPPPRPLPAEAVEEAQMQRFLIALARLKRRTAADVAAAVEEFGQLCRERPDFALAQAYSAAAQLLATEYDLLPLPSALQGADQAIKTALRLDPDLGMAHAARGLYWMNQDRYDAAVPQLARAAALDPGDATIALWLGNAQLYHGAPSDALPWLQRALDLDPELASVQISLGEAACLSADESRCERFLNSPKPSPMATFMGALLLAQRGEYALAHQRISQPLDGVNGKWVATLKTDLCRWFYPQSCVPIDPMTGVGASTSVNAAAHRPVLDLWRLDLGLSEAIRAARTDPETRSALLAELNRYQAGGLRIPILTQIRQCLDLDSASASTDPRWSALRQAWSCP